MSNYIKYRGKCKEMCDELIKENPELTLVRGHYICTFNNKKEEHWWTVDLNGEIVDPTKLQFLDAGMGEYIEFTGAVECEECGKVVDENDAIFAGRYPVCNEK